MRETDAPPYSTEPFSPGLPTLGLIASQRE